MHNASVALAGVMLLTVGTLMAYIAYACLNDTFPVVTFMFRDWPLVSSSTAGIGSTLLLYGMTLMADRRDNSYMLLSSCSIWLVVGSSNTFGNDAISWFHDIFTLLFLLFGTLSLASVLRTYRSWKVVCSMAWGLSAVASGLVLNIDKSLTNARVALGVSELLFVVTIGMGYFEFILGQIHTDAVDGNSQKKSSSVIVHLFRL